MLREQEEALWTFIAGQREDFAPEDWRCFDRVSREDLALAAAFCGMLEWVVAEEPRRRELRALAESLWPGVVEGFAARIAERAFDLPRFNHMLAATVRDAGGRPAQASVPAGRQAGPLNALRKLAAGIDGRLQAGGYTGPAIRMVLAGDCAAYRYLGDRYPTEVDALFSPPVLATLFNGLVACYMREDGSPAVLYVNSGFNADFALIPPRAVDRAIQWPELGSRWLEIYTVAPVDLALSMSEERTRP